MCISLSPLLAYYILIGIIKIRVANAPIFPQKQGCSQNMECSVLKLGQSPKSWADLVTQRLTKPNSIQMGLVDIRVCLLSFVKRVKVCIFLKDF